MNSFPRKIFEYTTLRRSPTENSFAVHDRTVVINNIQQVCVSNMACSMLFADRVRSLTEPRCWRQAVQAKYPEYRGLADERRSNTILGIQKTVTRFPSTKRVGTRVLKTICVKKVVWPSDSRWVALCIFINILKYCIVRSCQLSLWRKKM